MAVEMRAVKPDYEISNEASGLDDYQDVIILLGLQE